MPHRARHEILDLPGVRDVFVGEAPETFVGVSQAFGPEYESACLSPCLLIPPWGRGA